MSWGAVSLGTRVLMLGEGAVTRGGGRAQPVRENGGRKTEGISALERWAGFGVCVWFRGSCVPGNSVSFLGVGRGGVRGAGNRSIGAGRDSVPGAVGRGGEAGEGVGAL